MIGGIWYRVPEKILLDKNMTRVDIAIFAYIADRADGGEIQISRKELAENVDCSIPSVTRAIKKLSQAHYIEVTESLGDKSIYRQLMLEPKKHNVKPEKRSKKVKDDFDVSKYEEFINRFDDVKVV